MVENKQPVIELQEAVVTFERNKSEITAVDHVSLTIDRGEIYGIIGYSGAGKSTLIRLINHLQVPSAGKVIVNQQDLADLDKQQFQQARKKIGMIFQHFNLMNSRTILNNVEFPLLGEKLSKTERREKALALLKLVELEELADAFPDQLSGGQKQRVAIARALANNPDILVSDEATSALDPKTTLSILKLLQRLNQQLGLTIVLITHEIQVIQTICHRVGVMEAGKIIEQGKVSEVFRHPKERLTEEFIDTSINVQDALSRIQQKRLDNLFLLKFIGETTNQAVVTEMAQKYALSANILFANVDQFDDLTVGVMILALNGPEVTAGVNYLRQQGVRVEEIAKRVTQS
ncbi:methionine ABC transporter ATP-binding protein [Enterococcus hermanniensis]|uniref:ABC transporter domain-containing protein n=1 Tax=Enterococcus hermanniensis TaxID=249189 RepID=A0A1L8TSM2_9ENTE|nr:methionine ABC transporter ATP-binding protein [Enterococcus hermanniensis]OJG47178.1 hypothetical protein RV04_GL000425 [Enterococcus hermanniensis]